VSGYVKCRFLKYDAIGSRRIALSEVSFLDVRFHRQAEAGPARVVKPRFKFINSLHSTSSLQRTQISYQRQSRQHNHHHHKVSSPPPLHRPTTTAVMDNGNTSNTSSNSNSNNPPPRPPPQFFPAGSAILADEYPEL
jgi:hypothetical protein